MDNNTAERSERGPVVGRKNYYGSGSLWSGRLAAMMFSLFQTLCLWGLNPRLWLTAYLEACAQAGGRESKTWTGSCHGTSARSKGGRGDVKMRSRHRTPFHRPREHGQVPTRNSEHRPHSQPGTRPGAGYALNGSGRLPNTYIPG